MQGLASVRIAALAGETRRSLYFGCRTGAHVERIVCAVSYERLVCGGGKLLCGIGAHFLAHKMCSNRRLWRPVDRCVVWGVTVERTF